MRPATLAILLSAAVLAAPLIESQLEAVHDFPCDLRSRVIVAMTRVCDHERQGRIRAEIERALEPDRLQKYSLIFPQGLNNCTADVSEPTGQAPSVNQADVHEVRLVGNFSDTYENLAYKTGMVLKKLGSECSNGFAWLIKHDDDMVVDYKNLDIYLDSLERVANFLNGSHDRIDAIVRWPRVRDAILNQNYRYWWIGSELYGNRILSKGQNAELEYIAPYYPEYMSGPFYIMSADTVQVLSAELLSNRTMYRNEDAMIGILAQNLRSRREARIELTDLWERYIVTTFVFEQPGVVCERKPCEPEHVIAWPDQEYKLEKKGSDESAFWQQHLLALILERFTRFSA